VRVELSDPAVRCPNLQIDLAATECRQPPFCFAHQRASESICIELGRRNYRSAERDGAERETSVIWKKVLAQLCAEGKTKAKLVATCIYQPMRLKA